MKHRIDPTVDCVFKAVLGKEENKHLLIHFLNAVLKLEGKARIHDVIIMNPYNEREFESDKLSIIDVKAQDGQKNHYQIEKSKFNVFYMPVCPQGFSIPGVQSIIR